MYFVRELALVLFLASVCLSDLINFEDIGGIHSEYSEDTAWKNGALLNQTLLSLRPGDTLLFPAKTFYMMGGIIGNDFSDVTFQLDGTLFFSNDTHHWPTKDDGSGHVLECFQCVSCTVIKTSTHG